MTAYRKPSGDTRVDAAFRDNLRGVAYSAPAPPLPATGPNAGRVDFPTAKTPKVITHGLGAIPDAFEWRSWANNATEDPEQLYATAADVSSWTDSLIVVRSSVEGTVTFRVVKY